MTHRSTKPLRVLVTGGATGIGKTTCTRFIAAGASVAICDADDENINRATAELPGLRGFRADITNGSDLDRLFVSLETELGGLDVLINNAGISGPTAAVEDVSLTDWQRTLAVNITGQFNCTSRAVPLLKKSGGGSIVNISSAAGRFGYALRTPYAASKWAVIGFTKSLAMELGPYGIRVNAILPGIVAGEMVKRVIKAKAAALSITEDEMERRLVDNVSMRRMVTPEDVAEMIFFVCSEAGARISGQSLAVDGNLEVLR